MIWWNLSTTWYSIKRFCQQISLNLFQILIKKNERKNVAGDQQKIRVWDLFRRPLMRVVCFNVMFSWFTVSMVFYGLALNGGNLAGEWFIIFFF